MWKLIKRDINISIKSNIWKYILIILFVIVVCGRFYVVVGDYARKISGNGKFYIGDYLFLIFGGMKEYVPEKNNYFELPVIWMAMQLLLISVVFIYPFKDLLSNGQYSLVQYGKRSKWWISKIIWGLIQTVAGYVVIIGVILLFAILTGAHGLGVHKEYINYYYGAKIITDVVNVWDIVLCFIYNICITIMYMSIALLATPVVSLLLLVVYDVLSAYIMNLVLIGNASMLLRNVRYVDKGISALVPVIVLICITAITIVITVRRFDKKDIVGN